MICKFRLRIWSSLHQIQSMLLNPIHQVCILMLMKGFVIFASFLAFIRERVIFEWHFFLLKGQCPLKIAFSREWKLGQTIPFPPKNRFCLENFVGIVPQVLGNVPLHFVVVFLNANLICDKVNFVPCNLEQFFYLYIIFNIFTIQEAVQGPEAGSTASTWIWCAERRRPPCCWRTRRDTPSMCSSWRWVGVQCCYLCASSLPNPYTYFQNVWVRNPQKKKY